MDEEARELARQFFRKWSTQELTPAARKILEHDVMQMRILFDVYGEDPSLFEEALDAPGRQWFAERFNEL